MPAGPEEGPGRFAGQSSKSGPSGGSASKEEGLQEVGLAASSPPWEPVGGWPAGDGGLWEVGWLAP